MTIGQRIAQKRKEQNLSQETLGEALGVSRQAIYKWESDATLPEIEKLLALSRLFAVSVGWLLGVEEDTPAAESSTDSGELSEAQLSMVEEIVGRYLAAQPTAKKSPWGKWDVRILFGLCGLLVGVAFAINGKVDNLRLDYGNLQNSVANVSSSVNMQISSLTGRVEEILKAQNNLAADFGTELMHVNLRNNTAVFSVYAVPKTYIEGMTAVFSADNGSGGIQNTEAVVRNGEKFSATLACKLTDSINLSVIFVNPDSTRQIQLLDNFSGLYSDSFSSISIHDHFLMYRDATEGNRMEFQEGYASIREDELLAPLVYPQLGPAAVEKIELGLFLNQKLVSWLEPCEKPRNFASVGGAEFYRLPDQTLTIAEEDVLCLAARVTDEYGRCFMQYDVPYALYHEGDGRAKLRYAGGNSRYSTNPADWEF